MPDKNKEEDTTGDKEVDEKQASDEKTTAASAAAASGADEAPKRKPKKVVIPFVLPWESRPCKQTQKGMGAFGTHRKVVSNTTKPVVEPNSAASGAMSSDMFLSMFANVDNCESQKGMRAFGSHRANVIKVSTANVVQHEKAKQSECIIPRQSGTSEAVGQSGQTPIGAIRQNVMKVSYKPNMTGKMDPESKTFLSRIAQPNPNCHAGTAVIDHFRKQVPRYLDNGVYPKHSRKTESILPKLYEYHNVESPKGTGAGTFGLGPFRQVITPVKDVYPLTQDEISDSNRVTPWTTAPSHASQQGTGGFQKRRDVIMHVQ
ncbi:unnamed protein product [Soboliphyme baturini]|uniref:Microtubule-associated protein Jupiter n=1 Tax=Soboliphyme baturini TaxID=241478 RepID=A0A183ITK3_9BILA|nr:unnamed protein product [Soboliphyme baturini]